MFIKPSKKWRNPEGDQSIMVPYTYYRLCESYREAGGKVRQRTVLGLGELPDFPTEADRKELADLLTSMINEGTGKLCDNPRLNALGYRKIHFLSHRYFMLYRIEGNLAVVDNIFHELQDYENRAR